MATSVSRSATAPSLHHLFRSRNAAASFRAPVVWVLKTASLEGGSSVSGGQDDELYRAPSLLRKPVVINGDTAVSDEKDRSEPDEQWEDWEDRILEETVPLVGFVRTVLHSGKYKIGDRLRPEHQNIILERLLPYHPEYEAKTGCGVESITVGYHSEFKGTRCLFVVRKDGQLVDFSYWKCIKGLIRKKYPLFADAFILRHFRQRRRNTRN